MIDQLSVLTIRTNNGVSSMGKLSEFITDPRAEQSRLISHFKEPVLIHPNWFEQVSGLFVMMGWDWKAQLAVVDKPVLSNRMFVPLHGIRALTIGLHPCDFVITHDQYIIWLGEPRKDND